VFSKTVEYALRAVVTMARVEEDRPVLAREVAADGHIPAKYVSKVLRQLVMAGILSAGRGLGGGFRFRRRIDRLKLIDVVRPFDRLSVRTRCILGQPRCSPAHPCSMHCHFDAIREKLCTLLEETTVGDLIARERANILGENNTGKSVCQQPGSSYNPVAKFVGRP